MRGAKWLSLGAMVAGLGAAFACSSSTPAAPYPDAASFCSALANAECQVTAACGSSLSDSACESTETTNCTNAASAATATGKRTYQQGNAKACIDLATKVGLADRLDHRPFQLSGGQQQLLCLARALAVEPDVLLLDEPTSSLDPRSTEAVEELVRRLTPELSVIIVTHNLAQARRLSDNTIFFYEGRLVETGPTADLFERPQRNETARYLGGTE